MEISMYRRLFFVISTAVLAAVALNAQPKLKVTPGSTFDFGDVYNGNKVERVISVKNIGTDTLNIKEVKAQCGCTAAMMTAKKIAPRDSGQLSISFDTHNYSGRVTKHVYIDSDDTTTAGKTTIEFSANVMTVMDLNPKIFSFNNSKLDSTYTKVVTLTNTSKEAIKLISIENKFDQMKVTTLKNQLMPGEQTQIQAELRATKTGSFQGEVTLVTDHPVQQKFEIKYFAWINRK